MRRSNDRDASGTENDGWASLMLFLFLTTIFIIIFLKGFLYGYDFAITQTQPAAETKSSSDFPVYSSEDDPLAVFQEYTVFVPTTGYNEAAGQEYVEAFQEMYRDLVRAAMLYEEEAYVTLPEQGPLTMKDILPANELLAKDPALFWVSKASWVQLDSETDAASVYTISLEYRMTKTERDYYVKQISTAVQNILAAFPAESIADSDSASKTVMDWLAKNCQYARDPDTNIGIAEYPFDTVAGPLLYGKAICSGYAKAYSLLMAYLGYPTAFCTGNSFDEYHAWNQYQSKDGSAYAADPTFYSESKDQKWLKSNPEDFPNHNMDSAWWFISDTRSMTFWYAA